jgi:polar amino acid transport system substrate-binding protein
MSRLPRLLALAAVASLALSACSSTSSGGGEVDGVKLIKSGTLTLCTNPPYPPFEEKDGDKVVGLDIDVVAEVAKDLGVPLTVVETGFDGIESGTALDAGTCDVAASGMTITEAREAKLDFSDPYFDANQGVLVGKDSGIKDLDGLKGKTVGVQLATTGADFAKEKGLETKEYEDTGLQVQALRNGDVPAIINDIATLQSYVDKDFVIGAEFETGEHYGIAVKTGNKDLLDKVNAALKRITSDGTYDTIYAKYFPDSKG